MNYNFNDGGVHREEYSVGGGESRRRRSCPPSSWAPPTPCDGCGGAPSSVYCLADSAYLCASCDARVHAANCIASRHERVGLYEAQVRYANQLISGTHQRVPVLLALPADSPIPPASSLLTAATGFVGDGKGEVASWALGEVDEYFGLVGYNSYYDSRRISSNQEQYGMQHQEQEMQMGFGEKEGSECVVPSHSQAVMLSKPQQRRCGVVVAAEQPAASMTAGVSPYTDSISNSGVLDLQCPYDFTYSSDHLPIQSQISFSPMEVSIVPDNTVLDMPQSGILIPTGAISLFSGPSLQKPLNFSSTDREARVLRYKEKKKTRKFEKTTRYATRKAYAEARPRIKGRFAKRSDADIELDQLFSSAALSDGSYSTVPWF